MCEEKLEIIPLSRKYSKWVWQVSFSLSPNFLKDYTNIIKVVLIKFFHIFRCDVLCMHLRASPSIRLWFGLNMLFNHMNRFCEYLLGCPSNEVRSAFMKLVVLLAHFSIKDPPCPCPQGISNPDVNANLSDHVIWALLALLQREVSEHGRHLPHYCTVFHMYANQGKLTYFVAGFHQI